MELIRHVISSFFAEFQFFFCQIRIRTGNQDIDMVSQDYLLIEEGKLVNKKELDEALATIEKLKKQISDLTLEKSKCLDDLPEVDILVGKLYQGTDWITHGSVFIALAILQIHKPAIIMSDIQKGLVHGDVTF